MIHRRLAAVFIFIAVIAFCCAPPPAGVEAAEQGQDPQAALREDAIELSGHYVSGAVANAQAAAAIENLNRQREQLSSGAPGGLVNMLRDNPSAEHKALEAILTDASRPVAAALERQVATAADQRKQLVADWTKVRTALYHQQLELFEVKGSQQIAGQVASLLSVDNRWFWLCGVLAIASLATVSTHERRHEMRRWLFGGRARALGLAKFLAILLMCLVLVTLVVFLLGDHVYQWLLQAGMGNEPAPHQAFVAENKKLDAETTKMAAERQTAEKQFQAAFETWRKRRSGDTSQVALFEQDEQVRQWTVRLAAELAAIGTTTAAIARDLKDLDQANAEIARSAEQRDAYLRQKQWIRGGLGIALLGLSAVGGLAFRRGVRSRLRKTRETCPLCLGQGTFEPLGDAARPGLEMVRCSNVISEHPYEECDFTFSSMYRENIKLCFPTLGIPQAGKTHWLAMVYRELNRGNFPKVIQFERIRSTSSDEFDVVVDEILNKKLGPMATQVGRIPHPLIFNFLDHDRFGPSNVLVNIFDYSGEVTRSQTIEDRQRQRALDGDGFFFFLDPTEPSETQSQALAGFREDLRRIKGIRAGQQVHVPIALCVSKLDLMINQSYADPQGGGVIEKFYRDLGEVGWDLSVSSIEARSRFLAHLRDTVWPGWQIERQIDDLFGGRYLFFPLTPVGLDGPGERDLTRRTIAPVGLIEPLLWLLHMNGYPVLP